MTQSTLIHFTRQLGTLIKAGLAVPEAVKLLSDQARDTQGKAMLVDLHRQILDGRSFGQALSAHPRVFSELYIQSVLAGEETDRLVEVLKRLAGHLALMAETRRKVIASMIYPVVLLAASLATIGFLSVFVIPTFSKIYGDFGSELPLLTRVVLRICGALKLAAVPLLVVLGAAGLAWKLGRARSGLRLAQDRLVLSLPWVGGLWKGHALASFCANLGFLLNGGIFLTEALGLAAKAVENRALRGAVLRAKDRVVAGSGFGAAMAGEKLFPAEMGQMLGVGEQSGALEEMLESLGSYYQIEVSHGLEIATRSLEPLLIVVMGSLVGILLIAMYLPIFQMSTVVQ